MAVIAGFAGGDGTFILLKALPPSRGFVHTYWLLTRSQNCLKEQQTS